MADSVWPKPHTAWGFDAAGEAGPEIAALAVVEGDATEHVERVLGRRVDWRRTRIGLREAIGRVLPLA